MPKYRKKPVVIEAETCRKLILTAAQDWSALPQWFRDSYDLGEVVITSNGMSIATLEGIHQASLDDVVICGVKGELYPCKPDIFALTYEPVEELQMGPQIQSRDVEPELVPSDEEIARRLLDAMGVSGDAVRRQLTAAVTAVVRPIIEDL